MIRWAKADGHLKKSTEPKGYGVCLVPNDQLCHMVAWFDDQGTPVVLAQRNDIVRDDWDARAAAAAEMAAACEAHATPPGDA